MSYRKHLMPSNIAPSAVYEATAVDHDTDTISRKAAITAIDNCGCDGKDSCGEPWIYKENAVEAIEMVEPLPPATEPLTDKEQRIFLAAMEREEKVCEEIDGQYVREAYEDNLVNICQEIKRKVKGALWA